MKITTVRRRARTDLGFTLIEVLVVLAITSLVLTLGAGAFRHYWFKRSLYGSQDLIVTEMRAMQEKAVSESHPLVYGLRFQEGSGRWAEVVYNPKDQSISSDDTCEYVGGEPAVKTFEAGVVVETASFAAPPGLTPSICPAAATGDFVFFYAKGTATSGAVAFGQPSLSDEIGLSVSALTGRVTKT